MCLHSKKKKPNRAKRDIICYKILVNNENSLFPYKTLCKGTLISSDIISGIREFEGLGNRKNVSFIDNLKETIVSEGYIHTYIKLSDAFNSYDLLNYYFKNDRYIFYIFECIIPRGTRYYKGIDSNFNESYASEKIKFIEKVK